MILMKETKMSSCSSLQHPRTYDPNDPNDSYDPNDSLDPYDSYDPYDPNDSNDHMTQI